MSLPSRTPVWSGIGRPLDFRHRSNRFVVIAAGLAGLGTLAWGWSVGRDEVVLLSFRVAVSVFLAWAIGRELDPDDTNPAAVATVVVLPLVALGPPSLSSSAAALIAVRIVVRTTGRSLQWIDGVVLIAAAAYLGTQSQTWPALAAVILAVGIDRFVTPPGPARTLWFSAVMAMAALVGAMAFSTPPASTQPSRPEWIVIGVTLAAALLALVTTRPPRSRGDSRDESLSQPRLRFGRMLVLLLVMAAIFGGGLAISGLSPLWAAIIGVAIAQVARRPRRDGSP